MIPKQYPVRGTLMDLMRRSRTKYQTVSIMRYILRTLGKDRLSVVQENDRTYHF